MPIFSLGYVQHQGDVMLSLSFFQTSFLFFFFFSFFFLRLALRGFLFNLKKKIYILIKIYTKFWE